MREISFRAFVLRSEDGDDKRIGKMFYGVEATYDNSPPKIGGDSFGSILYQAEMGNYALMQFTGLKDKNDKDIYEGDIVTVGDMNKKVVFKDAKFQLTGFTEMYNAFYDIKPSEELEVIGNIYEHPGLIKETK